jgi:hypothetical protein
MHKKAIGNLLEGNVIYVILALFFVVAMVVFIWSKSNGANVWQDYYAKEIVKVINSGKPGDYIVINVQQGTKIAARSGLNVYSATLFNFDSKNNKVCLKLTKGSQTCYSYFNDVAISNISMEWGVPENMLHFSIVAKTGSNQESVK